MADLAVSRAEVSGAGCNFKDCIQPNNVTASYTLDCTDDEMFSVSRCVVDAFNDPGARSFLGAMWSNGGSSDMIPQIRLREHTWLDPDTNIRNIVAAVHTVARTNDVTWNQCPASDEYASLTVPCYRRIDVTSQVEAAMSKPTGSAWVTAWLEDEFAADSSSFGKLLLVPIILGGVALIGAIVLGCVCWRRRRSGLPVEDCDVDDSSQSYDDTGTPVLARILTDTSSRQTTLASTPSRKQGGYSSAGPNKTLEILLGSDHLQGKRLPYESIVFERTISKGASGEVWICEYNGQQVAAKRLLQSKDQKAEHVQAFAQEIELSASLVHPNIVEFIGVAWSSLNNLVMVLEFFPMGNLQSYLHQNSDLLSWARDKIHMAIGIASALEYLHARTPPLIHRDLKSNNILLTDKLEPKLIDFGVSRDTVDLTMTAGVGTPYWTAPEILEGKRYTEQADIYSFGVVLTELDTGRIPYADAGAKGGAKLKPFQILNSVMTDHLRPSFSKDCPPCIQRVGLACLALLPTRRPTAKQLVRKLEGCDEYDVYSF